MKGKGGADEGNKDNEGKVKGRRGITHRLREKGPQWAQAWNSCQKAKHLDEVKL